MVETLKLEEKNMKKIKENAETLVAVERERERARETNSLFNMEFVYSTMYIVI